MVDTSALFAVVSAEDGYHARATAMFEALVNAGDGLHLTSYVFMEASALIHRRLGFEKLKTLVSILEPAVEWYWIDELVHREAWDSFVRRNGSGLSLVDWTTALVARQLSAPVFTFDRGFEREGLLTIAR